MNLPAAKTVGTIPEKSAPMKYRPAVLNPAQSQAKPTWYRFSLRALFIVLVFSPPLIAGAYFTWKALVAFDKRMQSESDL